MAAAKYTSSTTPIINATTADTWHQQQQHPSLLARFFSLSILPCMAPPCEAMTADSELPISPSYFIYLKKNKSGINYWINVHGLLFVFLFSVPSTSQVCSGLNLSSEDHNIPQTLTFFLVSKAPITIHWMTVAQVFQLHSAGRVIW